MDSTPDRRSIGLSCIAFGVLSSTTIFSHLSAIDRRCHHQHEQVQRVCGVVVEGLVGVSDGIVQSAARQNKFAAMMPMKE